MTIVRAGHIDIDLSRMQNARIFAHGRRSTLYFDPDDDQGSSLIKIFKADPNAVDYAYSEYEAGQTSGSVGIRKSIGWFSSGYEAGVRLRHLPGVTLSQDCRGKRLNALQFLRLAIPLAKAVLDLHESGWYHFNLHPDNIVLHAEQGPVLIGMSRSAPVSVKSVIDYSDDKSVLEYIAPEQTGRLNVQVSGKADLYALGVIFYELLTGSTPFSYGSKFDLLYALFAKLPQPPTAIVGELPSALSMVVMKLLEKNPDERYRDATHLLRDLETALTELRGKGNILSKLPSASSSRQHFELPARLYGRSAEIDRMQKTYNRIASGDTEVLIVRSAAGGGKTALVMELQQYVDQKRGFFAAGKFEQYQRHVPNVGLNQAIGTLLNRFMFEEADVYEGWKTLIRENLGEYGGGLAKLLPEIANFIDAAAAEPDSTGLEAINRVNYAYKELIRILAGVGHPLVVFLDDMQWADSASTEFLEWLLSNRDIRHLLVVLSFRSEELKANHLLEAMLGNLRKGSIPVQEIELRSLNSGDIKEMLDDVFGDPAPFTGQLAAWIWNRTNGNPFFTQRLLQAINNRGLVGYDRHTDTWSCYIEKVQSLHVAGDVVELLSSSIEQLDPVAADVLRRASCIGGGFAIPQLSDLTGLPGRDLLVHLNLLVAKGLLEKRHYEYFFVHDRIQQTAYDSLTPKLRARLHKKIGVELLHVFTSDDRNQQIFRIAHHLNNALIEVDGSALAGKLIEINVHAAIKAKAASAFDEAAKYLAHAFRYMGEDAWEKDHALALKLHTLSTEVAFLETDYERMELHAAQVTEHSVLIEDKMPVYEIRIMALRAQSRLLEAVQLVEEALGQLHVRFPANPGTWHVLKEILRVEWLLRGKTEHDLMHLPPMTDSPALTILRILSRHDSTVYIVNQKLMPLVLIKQLELTLKYGRAPVSPSAFVAYGMIWLAAFKNIKRGYRLARLSMAMAQLPGSRIFRSRVTYASMGLVFPFVEHIRKTIQPLFQAHVHGLEDGDFEHASFAVFFNINHRYHGGQVLHEVLAEIGKFLEVLTPLRQEIPLTMLRIYQQYVLNLVGRSKDPLQIEGEAFSVGATRANLEDSGDRLSFVLLEMMTAALHFYLGEPATALGIMNNCDKYWETFRSTFTGTVYMFHRALYAAGSHDAHSVRKHKSTIKLINRSLRHIARLVRYCPDNHLNKYDLLMAEKQRILGRKSSARSYYDKSITAARRYGFLQEEAVACERAGRFFHDLGEHVPAELYLQKAYDAYARWGAAAITSHLKATYPFLRVHGGELMDGAADPDSASLLEVANTLAAETDFESLLEKVMDLLKRISGARSACILIDQGGVYKVQAYFNDGGKPSLASVQPGEIPGLYSDTIVRFVTRSRQSVVTENAASDPRFKDDPHIAKNQIRSVLCIPLLHRQSMTGILYLENNLLRGGFSAERIDLFKTLSGQIAVSLENARLYRDMEEKVQTRTVEIEDERRKSEALLKNILPEFVAEELKREGRAKSRRYEKVTVLFTDFKGFTQLSEMLSPEELVAEIDYCFQNFDQIIGRFGLEKIKTIGDAYMCAGGIPLEHEDSVEDVVLAALEIRDFMEALSEERKKENRPFFEVRIGVHTGPVVAGVVGSRKFTYDIWGDTVNTASRMESSGMEGKVNISQATFDLIKDSFSCAPRGWVEAKNKGRMQMYWVDGRKPT
jgi:predicted ATPase/class 3 adenylate cyclase